jgi:hypothetical protein
MSFSRTLHACAYDGHMLCRDSEPPHLIVFKPVHFSTGETDGSRIWREARAKGLGLRRADKSAFLASQTQAGQEAQKGATEPAPGSRPAPGKLEVPADLPNEVAAPVASEASPVPEDGARRTARYHLDVPPEAQQALQQHFQAFPAAADEVQAALNNDCATGVRSLLPAGAASAQAADLRAHLCNHYVQALLNHVYSRRSFWLLQTKADSRWRLHCNLCKADSVCFHLRTRVLACR